MARAFLDTVAARERVKQGYRALNRETPRRWHAGVETLVFGGEHAARVQQVFEHHASQVQAITGGPGCYAALLADAASRLGHPGCHVERLWRLTPTPTAEQPGTASYSLSEP